MSLWDDVKKNLATLYDTAAVKTGEITKVGLRRYDIFGLSREIERQFSELGNHVYTAVNAGRTDFAGDETFDGLIRQVRDLEAQLAGKEREIASIRAQAAAEAEKKRAAAAAAAKTAPAAPVGEDVEDAEFEPVEEPEADSDPERPVE